jgi:hypothetical protein
MENNIATEMAMHAPLTIGDALKSILRAWKTHKRIRLNIFRLVSDTYYRENLHSDVIKILLESETHSDSIRLFIQLLNTLEPKLALDASRYADAKLERERGHIDILVHSPKNKCCIVIENKIHDAIDQKGQLSRYFTFCKNHDYKPEAIVYLSKDGRKEPSERAFSNTDKAEAQKLFVKVAAFADTRPDLVKGWLYHLQNSEKDNKSELSYLITQYIDVLTEMGEHMMNIDTEKQFMDWLREDPKNLLDAGRLAELYNRRTHLVLERIGDKYNEDCQKAKYNIVLAQSGPEYGGFAQIQVKTGSQDRNQIWLEQKNGGIGLWVDRLSVNGQKQSLCNLLKDKIASMPRLEADGTFRFRWPEDESSLYATIDRMLAFFQGQLAEVPASTECDSSGGIVDRPTQNMSSSLTPTAMT